MFESYEEGKNFETLNLVGETVEDVEFVDCHFRSCRFVDCQFSSVSFVDCVFTDCAMVSPIFSNSEMKHMEFKACQLQGISWEEVKPMGKIARLLSKMEGCTVKYSQFVDIYLDKVSFARSNIAQSMFANCALKSSDFSQCKLSETEFFQCDLQKSNFQQASSYTIDVATCKLKGGKFSMPEVLNLLDSFEIIID